MKRIYSVDKQFCNQFRYDSEFIARAEELGLVWSNPQTFIQSYNNRKEGTIPGQYILRVIDIDPNQPYGSSGMDSQWLFGSEGDGQSGGQI